MFQAIDTVAERSRNPYHIFSLPRKITKSDVFLNIKLTFPNDLCYIHVNINSE